ncbi:MAG: phosphoenolpyruvate carboxylase [Lewinellaceae bacterium]|nr:phosphoenolpyruvate carboxylase [Lewinellaceae bacterium]
MSTQIAKSFRELVELNFQLYNSLFLTLPLDAVQKTGNLIPLLQEACEKGFESGKDPAAIIDQFFAKHKPDFTEREQIDFLFKVIQYVERQVVLIDALEDAAYDKIHRIGGTDSWDQLAEKAEAENLEKELESALTNFGIRVVLTAHPTQFYPGQVLAIISDLTDAIAQNQTAYVRDLLQQLGKTPFFRKEKPTPYDEAVSLNWYLGHIFYPAVGKLVDRIGERFPEAVQANSELISIGFWPGGDRDGNPFVTIDTTRRVATLLRTTLISCYYRDMKELKRRLSYAGVYEKLEQLDRMIETEMRGGGKVDLAFLKDSLREIEELLIHEHQELFLDRLRSFRRKLELFGLYLASLDIRQDSRVIAKTLQAIMEAYPAIFPADLFDLPEETQLEHLFRAKGAVDPGRFADPVIRDTLESFSAIRDIQRENGEKGAHRYIISNCRGTVDIARVMSLFRLCGWGEGPLTVDIVPLFESVNDLAHAGASMRKIYEQPRYRAHLENRLHRQTIMLGFSDGTKDGGYLMANWAIFKAKEDITASSRDLGIEVVFFDGRGGPPARGGGNTHQFYASLGNEIESHQIQMTVQGQTISSLYGIVESAVHNLENLLTAGLQNILNLNPGRNLTDGQRDLIEILAADSYRKYEAFKNHPLFVPYLEERSTIKYYGMANIGSRPVKRSKSEGLRFEDLRAIPFVGAWSQLKQNVPGFYGLGSSLKNQEQEGNWDACVRLYQESRFFRTLIANSMQSMSKTFFPLTRYMENDERFGEFWKMIYNEFELSREMVLKISGQRMLLEDHPRSRMSIQLRERVVLPLLTIQQYAQMRIGAAGAELEPVYEKMVMRSLFGNINASRNSI